MSRIGSYGNAVYTLTLLKWFESGRPYTKQFITQSAISACFRAVCSRDPGQEPSPVKYKDKTVQDCINSVQGEMLDRAVDDDSGLTETLNQQARLYLTVFINNIFMRIVSWQQRTLRAELLGHNLAKNKPLVKFLVVAMSRHISGAVESNPNLYKDPLVRSYLVADDELYQEIVNRHKSLLVEALQLRIWDLH
jgi:hypothetical protein